MSNSGLRVENVASDMLASTFNEVEGHKSLGAEMQLYPDVWADHVTELAAVPVGSKFFIKDANHGEDPSYDAVGLVLGHQGEYVQALSFSPKNGEAWSMHNAYGEYTSEVADAMAAMDRLFDPYVEFGSIAVLSETTADLLGVNTPSGNIGQAGCNSHEKESLAPTLTMSQLLDKYNWSAVALRSDSGLVRRDNGVIIHVLQDQWYEGRPSREQRDQRSMLDRIDQLSVSPNSALNGLSPAAVLRGIETAIGRGDFLDVERPVSVVAQTIKTSAERIIT